VEDVIDVREDAENFRTEKPVSVGDHTDPASVSWAHRLR
jgi:hypothetical protein